MEARSGDTFVVVVSNQLKGDEGVSIHWHGLLMKGANAMDGVVGVTQKAIPAGEEFAYQFDISSSQSGTFWCVTAIVVTGIQSLTKNPGTIPIPNFSGLTVFMEVL